MREIKFRAWDKERKEIGSVASIEWNPDFTIKKALLVFGVAQDTVFADTEEEWVNGENPELTQYTGLKDKNGKEIYEGDILLVNKNSRLKVAYEGCGFALTDGHDRWWGLKLWSKDSEVIGNIYENPIV